MTGTVRQIEPRGMAAFSRKQPVRLLYIEDDMLDAKLFMQMLDETNPGYYQITHVRYLDDGASALHNEHFDLVAVDVNLPDATGVRSIERLQQDNSEVPIIFISGCTDDETAFELIEAGAQDFLSKDNVDPDQLSRAIRFSIFRKRTEERLRVMAQRDLLTGLPNRGLMEDRIQRAIARTSRSETSLALMFLDLDKFKAINDTFGHTVGDALLCAVAQRLQECVRETDTVSRLGGDEFTVLIEGITAPADVETVAGKIIDTINKPFVIGTTEIVTSTSVGVAFYPDAGSTAEMLLETADAAMYQAKSSGRNKYCLSPESYNLATARANSIT